MPTKNSIQTSIPKNNLRKLRILQNPKISQWMLALKSGIPQSRISLIENHLIKSTQEEKKKFAFALNISSSELFPDSTNLEIPFQNKQVKNRGPRVEEEIDGSNPLENL